MNLDDNTIYKWNSDEENTTLVDNTICFLLPHIAQRVVLITLAAFNALQFSVAIAIILSSFHYNTKMFLIINLALLFPYVCFSTFNKFGLDVVPCCLLHNHLKACFCFSFRFMELMLLQGLLSVLWILYQETISSIFVLLLVTTFVFYYYNRVLRWVTL